MNCAAPLDVGVGPMPAQVSTPQPPPYAYPARPRQDECFGQKQGEDQCLGQSRVPGLVVLAVIVILAGLFAILQAVYPNLGGAASGGIFLVVIGAVIIVLWLVLRRPRPRM